MLDALNPAERLAFVLHDMFAVPFDEMAVILGRSVPAAKMLASRARRRVRTVPADDRDLARRWTVVEAFLAASRNGDFTALLALLHPEVTARPDAFAAPDPAVRPILGADAVARQALAFSHRAHRARVALVDGSPALLVAVGSRLVTALTFTFAGDRIAAIDIVADPAVLARLNTVLHGFS